MTDMTTRVYSIEDLPRLSGTYVVGHRGWQEVMKYFSPSDAWVPGTKTGWKRFSDRHGWTPIDPKKEFGATHWWTLPDLTKIKTEAPIGA